MQGADLVGHDTWDPLQGAEPLPVPCSTVRGEQEVRHVPVSSQNLGGPVGERLAEACSGLQALSLGATEAGGGADLDAFDGGAGLDRQAVAHSVDGHLAHGGLAGPDGGHGVHSPPEVNPADEVSPVDGDELSESRRVLVVIGGGKILQGNLELLTQRRTGVKTETAGREGEESPLTQAYRNMETRW